MLSKSLENALEQVQPRVCGEYIDIIVYSETIIGSTPRMRGISLFGHYKGVDIRFNPAYAGNITALAEAVTLDKVQPRVCGEYLRSGQSMKDRTGSTPRMRGICNQGGWHVSRCRFNPAYAGNIIHYEH